MAAIPVSGFFLFLSAVADSVTTDAAEMIADVLSGFSLSFVSAAVAETVDAVAEITDAVAAAD